LKEKGLVPSSGKTTATSQATVASKQKMPLPLPDKLSIAVLPFVNVSGDKEQEYFSDGLTDEIINAVSKLRNVFVIARNSSFAYKGKNVNVKQVAEELGVQYVLEGSVRKTGDKVRVTAQLVDALSGRELMSERYERSVRDMFAIQDELTMKVLATMGVVLEKGETAWLTAKGTKNLEAYLKVVQASQVRYGYNEQSFATAKKLAEEAIALDPKYAMAYAVVGMTLANEVNIGQYKDPREVLERARKYGEKAVALDDSLAYAHVALGLALVMSRDYDRAISEAQRAVDLEPGSAVANLHLGVCLSLSGQYQQSLPALKKSLRLSPVPIPTSLSQLGFTYRMLGQYQDSIAVLKELTQREPDSLSGRLHLAASYMLAGKESEARAEVAEVLRINPNFSLEQYANSNPMKNRIDLTEHFIEPLRKAGLK
jgi:adenylate cyclase